MKQTKFFLLVIIVSVGCCRSQSIDKNIVLVNVSHLDRARIAKEIEIINSLNPKVIALDLQFKESMDGDMDMLLINALWKCENLVMGSLVNDVGDGRIYIVSCCRTEFVPLHAKTGFINAMLEDDEVHTQKRFIVQRQDSFSGEIEYHFSVRTAMAFDSLRVINFIKTHPNINDCDFNKGQKKFREFSASEVLAQKVKREDIEGKIVMLGFLGPGNEDKFYTPLNKKRPPLEPDMYGLEYLAYIVAQILE